MSRSRRKPWVKDGYKSGTPGRGRKRKSKRRANRTVRHSTSVPSGGAYKKEYCSWEICDYRWYEPKNEKLKRK